MAILKMLLCVFVVADAVAVVVIFWSEKASGRYPEVLRLGSLVGSLSVMGFRPAKLANGSRIQFFTFENDEF